MKNIIPFKIVIYVFWVFSLFLLVSCGVQEDNLQWWDTNPEQNQSYLEQDNQIEKNSWIMDLVSQVSDRFWDDENFLMCMENSVDMCMQETLYMTEGGLSNINCDKFLSEEGRDSCQFTQVFSQAQSTWDIALCEQLSWNYQETCMFELNMMLAMDTGDLSICEWLGEFEKINCNNRILISQAVRKMDVSYCENVLSYPDEQENSQKISCQEQIEFLIQIEQEVDNNMQDEEINNDIEDNM